MTGALPLDRSNCVQKTQVPKIRYAVIRFDDATVDHWDHTGSNEVMGI